MTVSTIVAAGLVIAVVCIVVGALASLLRGRPSTRRGSGNPGIPFISSWGMSGNNGSCDNGGYSGDSGGGFSGGDSGGGGCG
ncbi:hypothetical protein GCM10022224_017150 [Nonomuraea antimicrobica]|uniref:Methanol dehydrogenase n=1 Tax=Nonomuraea antimicrobica TaxID=561173 RepID=A0ABP7BC74_9ACTN